MQYPVDPNHKISYYVNSYPSMWFVNQHYLVGGFNSSQNYESQLGWLFPIYGKMKFMFQTTNQLSNPTAPLVIKHKGKLPIEFDDFPMAPRTTDSPARHAGLPKHNPPEINKHMILISPNIIVLVVPPLFSCFHFISIFVGCYKETSLPTYWFPNYHFPKKHCWCLTHI